MSVSLRFTQPQNYNLEFYQIGQSSGLTDTLNIVASGTDIGSYPTWINQVSYSGSNTFYYAVRFGTDDGGFTAWTDRMYGRYGAGPGYFIVHSFDSEWVYLVPPQISGIIPDWLEYNYEYTVTIDASGLYGSGLWGSGTNYMETDYTLVFGAELCPLWSTVDSVRLVAGPMLDVIPDDTINKMIHRASLQAISRFFVGSNPYGCSYTSVPEPVYRWVTCMSAMMALNAAIASDVNAGNTKKKLGAFSVDYGGSGDGAVTPSDIRKSLQTCLDESSISIQAGTGTLVAYAVKSLNNSYIQHPMTDPEWGRHPNAVDVDIDGPWRRAYNDIKLYSSEYMNEGTLDQSRYVSNPSGVS